MAGVLGREVRCLGARVAGVVACLPRDERRNADFEARFGAESVAEVTKMIGVQSRRHADASTTTRDLCRVAGQRLLEGLGWSPDSVDAVIFVSQTPDHVLPSTAFLLQADWGLPPGGIVFDVNLGCSAYPHALWLGMSMIAAGTARRVLLAVGDTVNRVVDPQDRATALLFGDAGTVTALEADPSASAVFVLGADGRGAGHLIVPEGAARRVEALADPRLAGRQPDRLFMDGGAVFEFTLTAVPKLVERLAALSEAPHDAFLLHQANLFMLKHLAKKCRIEPARFPVNIERYGNTSSASIPLLMATNLAPALAAGSMHLALVGFGVGFSWGGASLTVGPLAVIDTVEAP